MSGPSWWLSYQRTMVPISAIVTAAQARREPIMSKVSDCLPPKKPSQ